MSYLTQQFPTLPAAVAHFNAPANAALRLVSVLPPDATTRGFTALYETLPDPVAELETERQRLLEERVLALVQLDDDRKRGHNFPESIIDELLVPLSIVNNKLGQLAAFKGMDNATRAQWIRVNVAAVGCAYVSSDEARTSYRCAAELIRLEE